jgi:hypothetical protein
LLLLLALDCPSAVVPDESVEDCFPPQAAKSMHPTRATMMIRNIGRSPSIVASSPCLLGWPSS